MAKNDTSGFSVASMITNQIIAALEEGVVPWKKTWRSKSTRFPTSLSTGKRYNGINTFILWLEAFNRGYDNQLWATWNWFTKHGFTIQEEKKKNSVCVIFQQPIKIYLDDNEELPDEERNVVYRMSKPRYWRVYNVAQLNEEFVVEEQNITINEPIYNAEKLMTSYLARENIRVAVGEPAYHIGKDVILIPSIDSFNCSEGYYSTMFHEAAHSTGHKSRLSRRTLGHEFGSKPYATEELIAELSASIMCAHTNTIVDELQNSAAYIQAWLDILGEDGNENMIIDAGRYAEKAVNFIIGENNA